MDERTLKKLEFDKIREMLSGRCCSVLGAALARELAPSCELLEIRDRQRETAEAVAFVIRTGTSPMRSFDDIGDCVGRPGSAVRCPSLSSTGGRDAGRFPRA